MNLSTPDIRRWRETAPCFGSIWRELHCNVLIVKTICITQSLNGVKSINPPKEMGPRFLRLGRLVRPASDFISVEILHCFQWTWIVKSEFSLVTIDQKYLILPVAEFQGVASNVRILPDIDHLKSNDLTNYIKSQNIVILPPNYRYEISFQEVIWSIVLDLTCRACS
jgi:hypothetical protein